jgi:hypothetical protein
MASMSSDMRLVMFVVVTLLLGALFVAFIAYGVVAPNPTVGGSGRPWPRRAASIRTRA